MLFNPKVSWAALKLLLALGLLIFVVLLLSGIIYFSGCQIIYPKRDFQENGQEEAHPAQKRERDTENEEDEYCAIGAEQNNDIFNMPLKRIVTEVAPRAGYLAPPFSLEDLDGQEYSLEDYRDQSLLVIFWNSRCPACAEDLFLLEELSSSEKQISILSINVREEESAVEEYVQKHSFSFPVLLDRQGEVFHSYLLAEYPTTLAIYRGEIKLIHTGAMGHEGLKNACELALNWWELKPLIK